MKITREQLKNIVREVMTEESEYQTFFKKALEKTGKSIPQMSDEEKKAFFNKIDAAWKGKGEKNETVNKEDDLEYLKLLNLAMKALPQSPQQKQIIKKLNKIRVAGGMKPLK